MIRTFQCLFFILFVLLLTLGLSWAAGTALDSGIVAGLVAITPAAGFVTPFLVLGFLSGIICYYSVAVMKPRFGCDDSLDAFGVHGVGGAWGAIGTGLFATVGTGSLLTGDVSQLVLQIVGVVVTVLYAAVVTWLLFSAIDKIRGIRVSEEDERVGLDQTRHSEIGYNF